MKTLTANLTANQDSTQNHNNHQSPPESYKKSSDRAKVLQNPAQEDMWSDYPSALSIDKENLISLINDADESLNFVLLVANDPGKSKSNHILREGDCILYDIEPEEMQKLVESFAANLGKLSNAGHGDECEKSGGKVRRRRVSWRLELTETEIEILRLICDEKTSEEIAEEVCLGRRTIEHYRRRILIKTDCQSPMALVKFAIKNGLYGNI